MGVVRGLIRAVMAEIKPSKTLPDHGTSAHEEPFPPDACTATQTAPASGNKGGRPRPYRLAFHMAQDASTRRSRSLHLTHLLAWTLIIVGAIFLGLVLGGAYPTSKATMQYLGIFTDYWVKYMLYIASGVAGTLAVVLAKRMLAAGHSTAVPQLLLLLGIASTLATIGLTIYLLTKSVSHKWWSILLQVLMLIQRLLFAAVAGMAFLTLREANSDAEVAAHVAAAQGVAAVGPQAAVPEKPLDDPKAVLV